MFVDEVEIIVHSGKGGDGCVSFRREKYVPRGGPDGGDGGSGGHVFLLTDPGLNQLLPYRYKKVFRAQNGGHGRGKNQTGHNGENLYLPVPPGTIVYDNEGHLVADLTEPGQVIRVARGGRGGKGNARFATPTQQAPNFAEPGEKGETRRLKLELKTLADVGLVGLPNAGKSTFLSAVSSAHPAIAAYPFTTLTPHVGVVALTPATRFVIADIPGIIEGAAGGRGLGLKFLRHIERTRLLLYLIDCSDPTADSVESYKILTRELQEYKQDLIHRTSALVATKFDVADPHNLAKLRTYAEKAQLPFFAVSALRGDGLQEVMSWIADRLGKNSTESLIPVTTTA